VLNVAVFIPPPPPIGIIININIEIRAPKAVWDLVQAFWEKNKAYPKAENWGVGKFFF
jgi:hypothetical protein